MIFQKSIVLQLLGIAIATGAAMWDVESIVFTLPVLFLTGVGIAIASFLAGRSCGFYFALAAPTVAVVCFSIICGLEWSPYQAQKPIAALLLVFSSLAIPLGVFAVLERRRSPIVRHRRRFQFGISTMLWAMVVGAILCGPIATLNPQWIAVSVSAMYLIVAGNFAWRFHANRSIQTVADQGKPQ